MSADPSILTIGRFVALAPESELLEWSGLRGQSPALRAEALRSTIAGSTEVKVSRLDRFAECTPVERAAVDNWILSTLGDGSNERAWLELYGRQTMPVVDSVGEFFRATGLDLSSFVVLAVQHLLGSSVAVFEWLNRLGLPYGKMFVLGKSYSAHEGVLGRLKSLGVNVFRNSEGLEPRSRPSSDETYLRSDIARLVEGATRSLGPRAAKARVLLIDDGGLLIEMFASSRPAMSMRTSAIEQTRHGANLLRDLAGARLPFPVVNVAECATKLHVEADLIGTSVIRSIEDRLSGLGASWKSLERGLVVGFGTVGRAVAHALRRRGLKVSIADRASDPQSLARADGFAIVQSPASHLRGIVVGCTGSRWWKSDPPRVAQRALLASASTADLEFGPRSRRGLERILFRRSVEALDNHVFRSVHSDYRDARGDVLLNGGFPVNFDGSLDPIPPSAIQVTRALILAGACFAARGGLADGLVPLDPALDHMISGHFRAAGVEW